MKHQALLTGLAFGLLATPLSAMAADYAVINLEVSVAKPAAQVWATIGDYCPKWITNGSTCVFTTGSGGVGTVRRIGDRINEVMVARTEASYTYTQPTTTILYHGTLAVRADGPAKSVIAYTLFYDQEPLGTPEAKAKDQEARSNRFRGALQNMKKAAEGS